MFDRPRAGGAASRFLKWLARRLPPATALAIKDYRDVQRRVAILERETARSLWCRPTPTGRGSQRQQLHSVEARVHSQNGEDGVVAFLFSQIGVTDGTFIEIGIEDGRECNTACLSLYEGWRGLLVDADRVNVDRALVHYGRHLGPRANRVAIVHALVTRDNVGPLLVENGYSGEVDLFSLDIDGNDYWVWEALLVVNPRVVIVEYNAFFADEVAVTVPYSPAFRRNVNLLGGRYFGASLAALEILGRRKGYVLVGCESRGVNAFFVRSDVAAGRFDHMPSSQAYVPRLGSSVDQARTEFARMASLPYVVIK